ncbi:hypothetical protein HKD37_U058542 [Glycine soja]
MSGVDRRTRTLTRFHIRIGTHRQPPIAFPPRQFQALFDSAFQRSHLFIFPTHSSTCSLAVSALPCYLARDGIYRFPIRGCIPKQPGFRQDGASWCDRVEGLTGALTLQAPPSEGLRARSAQRGLLQDYNSDGP